MVVSDHNRPVSPFRVTEYRYLVTPEKIAEKSQI